MNHDGPIKRQHKLGSDNAKAEDQAGQSVFSRPETINLQKLQRTIGNQGVQRLLAKDGTSAGTQPVAALPSVRGVPQTVPLVQRSGPDAPAPDIDANTFSLGEFPVLKNDTPRSFMRRAMINAGVPAAKADALLEKHPSTWQGGQPKAGMLIPALITKEVAKELGLLKEISSDEDEAIQIGEAETAEDATTGDENQDGREGGEGTAEGDTAGEKGDGEGAVTGKEGDGKEGEEDGEADGSEDGLGLIKLPGWLRKTLEVIDFASNFAGIAGLAKALVKTLIKQGLRWILKRGGRKGIRKGMKDVVKKAKDKVKKGFKKLKDKAKDKIQNIKRSRIQNKVTKRLTSKGTQVRGKFPETAKPNDILYRADANGKITHYQVYDQHGLPLRRVDVTGDSHGGIPTPHVLEYTRGKVNPKTGLPFVNKGQTRPFTPEDIP